MRKRIAMWTIGLSLIVSCGRKQLIESGSQKGSQASGAPTEVAVSGDWNGDGRMKAGYYRNGQWALDYDGDGKVDAVNPGNDRFFQYTATAGDIPVVGDWNGDGKTSTGVFRAGQWILDVDGDGAVDYKALGNDKVFQYTATPGDKPLVGDWNGDGRTKTGIARGNIIILDVNGDGKVDYANPGADRVIRF
jgi:hypothetical protein